MKGVVLILISVISITAQAQQDISALLQTTKGVISTEVAASKIESFVSTVQKSNLSDKDRLHKVFKKINSVFLKKYVAYSDFDELFTSGKYDCLTATAIYSLVLDRLHYAYEIIETNYHIFLVVQTSEGEVLIETTDRFGGFICGAGAIASRLGSYRENVLATNTANQYLRYSFKLYQPISAANLNGLLYFNQAVKAFNKHMLLESAVLLEKSNLNYSSPRCEELGMLLAHSVMQSTLDQQTKAACLSYLNHIIVRKEVAGLD
ncbi:MAG TPA: hypothetical protein VG737_02600 [Cyclobacteriaceae bacterium]|nr:hypothetical protein [Cyclobacteriaceae bacterium]